MILRMSLVISLVSVSLLPLVIADDGSGCSSHDSWGLSTNCFVQKLYQQNQILIQEQNQTNHLLAYDYCKGTPTQIALDYIPTQQQMIQLANSKLMKDNPFQDCVNNVLGVTK